MAKMGTDGVGRVIDGRFPLLQLLGDSESGGVFLTELQGNGSQKAAIKLIPADAVDAEPQFACWEAASALSHPHLMRVLHTGTCQIDGVPLFYAVMEYANEILSQILLERPLTPTETREMLSPVLDALSYVHGKGFVHGCLKPSNIMVVEDQLKLSSDSLSVAGKLSTHPPVRGVYDAPETATGDISPAADIWSLGATLVETLTQHPLDWDRSTHRDPVVPDSIPQPFAAIAQECLRSDPALRCTLGDVRAHLEPARTIPLPAARATRRTVSAKLRTTALLAAVAVLFLVFAVLQLRSRRTEVSSPIVEQQPVPATPTQPPEAPLPEPQVPKAAALKGAVARQVLPDVLPSARQSIRGQVNVTIRVTVDPNGSVLTAVIESPGSSRYFAKVSLQAAKQWRFTPAQVDGQSVPSVWMLRFHFTQDATEVTPAEVSSKASAGDM
jgi:TonB family protein